MTISRRSVLSGIASLPATAAPALALAGVPMAAEPPEPYSITPAELAGRINDLALEIAELLNGRGDGQWRVEVHAAARFRYPVAIRRNAWPVGARLS